MKELEAFDRQGLHHVLNLKYQFVFVFPDTCLTNAVEFLEKITSPLDFLHQDSAQDK